MIARTTAALLIALLSGPVAARTFAIGLAADGSRIDAVAVEARSAAAPTVALVGGLAGDDAEQRRGACRVAAYEQRADRPVRLLAVPLANPDGAALQFPPPAPPISENPKRTRCGAGWAHRPRIWC